MLYIPANCALKFRAEGSPDAAGMKKRAIRPELPMVSLFSGAGGLDLGLEAAGFSTVLATDIDEHSCATLNWGKAASADKPVPFLRHAQIIREDIAAEGMADLILRKTGCKRGEIALLAGGPPCQAFSVFGQRRGRSDPRSQLAFHYLHLLAAIRPKAFVFENVYGLLTIESGKIFNELCERLALPGKGIRYQLSVFREDAVNFGVPQFRDRVFIIGDRDGCTMRPFQRITGEGKPSLFECVLPWRTVRDAFRGLPPIGSSYPANHVGRVHSDRIKRRYASLRAGERDHHTRINKLDLNRPSFTIIVGSDRGGGKGHIHPTEAREVTPRESARIQTFPDWWAFSGTSRHPIRQVGNAVPPIFAAAIGNEIRAQIFSAGRESFERIVDALGQEHLFSQRESQLRALSASVA
jgi:DNA (cytosine-5)-methyltransferase 1